MRRICPGCGGVVGIDCFNPVECVEIGHRMQQQQIDDLRRLQEQSHPVDDVFKDIRELAHFFGGWNEFKKVVYQLEQDDKVAVAEQTKLIERL